VKVWKWWAAGVINSLKKIGGRLLDALWEVFRRDWVQKK